MELLPLLEKNNCIKRGEFKLKSGEISKFYFDMKNLISNPVLLSEIGDRLYKLLGDFDIICGIPYGGLPIACYMSTKYNKPMIYFRDKQKTYGTKKLIEGEYKKTDRCIIIDDVITTGGSIREAIDILSSEVTIVDIAVVVDRSKIDTNIELKSLININNLD